MGQKANPISLRLKTTNKSFDSCWYSDLHYSTLLGLDLKARCYIDKIFEQIGYPKPLVSLSLMPKRAKMLLFYFNPERSRGERGERFQLRAFMPPRLPERRTHPLLTRPPGIGVEGRDRQPSLIGTHVQGTSPQGFTQPLRGARAGQIPLGITHLFGLGWGDGPPFGRLHDSPLKKGWLGQQASPNGERRALRPLLSKGSLLWQGEESSSLKLETSKSRPNERNGWRAIPGGKVTGPLSRESSMVRKSSHYRGWMANWERKLFIYSTLLSITKGRSNTARLLLDRDFALFYRVHRLIWFEGRGESCMSLICQRQSHTYVETGAESNRVQRPNRKEAPLSRSPGGLSNRRTSPGRGRYTSPGRPALAPFRGHGLHTLCSLKPSPHSILSCVVHEMQSRAMQSLRGDRTPMGKAPCWTNAATCPGTLLSTTTSVGGPMRSFGEVEPRSSAGSFLPLHCKAMQLPKGGGESALKRGARPLRGHNGEKELGGGSRAGLIPRLSSVSSPRSSIREIRRQGHHFSISLMEAVLSRGLGLPVMMYPYKSIEEEQTAQFLSEEIAYYLERRVPFRRIKQALMREIEKRYIEGVKVSCSGRVGGRSKKAQRAREESFQWGQTSSHVFSSKLCFASRSALTPFGKVGIKVWICYK